MRKMCVFRGLVAVTFLFGMVATANADLLQWGFDTDAAPSYTPGQAGTVINWELWVDLQDNDADGPDTQGLAAFSGDLLTNLGAAVPPVYYSATSLYPTFPSFAPLITTPLWTGTGKTLKQDGGFGMGFFGSLGNHIGDDVLGIGQSMPLTWDADIDGGTAGLQPYSLANIGYGNPSTAVDTGGNAFSPFYGTGPRAKWYIISGTVLVPSALGTYTVTWDAGVTSVISGGGQGSPVPPADLNQDDLNGYVEDITFTGTQANGSFSFMVVPEPATLSVLLFAGAGFVMRRRR